MRRGSKVQQTDEGGGDDSGPILLLLLVLLGIAAGTGLNLLGGPIAQTKDDAGRDGLGEDGAGVEQVGVGGAGRLEDRGDWRQGAGEGDRWRFCSAQGNWLLDDGILRLLCYYLRRNNLFLRYRCDDVFLTLGTASKGQELAEASASADTTRNTDGSAAGDEADGRTGCASLDQIRRWQRECQRAGAKAQQNEEGGAAAHRGEGLG